MESRLEYSDHPAGRVLRRIDDFDQTMSIMLRALEEQMTASGRAPRGLGSQSQPLSPSKLPLCEIVGIVLVTAFVTGASLVGLLAFWLR